VTELEPIEAHLRSADELDRSAQLVIRGWPLTIEGLLPNADATRRRYTRSGVPFVAISAEVTVAGWTVDAILAGPRLRTRRSYAAARVDRILDAGFELLPTFGTPHYSVVLPSYTAENAERLIDALGEVLLNPHYVRREL
jgi:hypothetical protein